MTIPATAIDIDLLRQTLYPASYAGVPFGVVNYTIQSGRDVEVIKLFKGAPSTVTSGSSSSRKRAAERVAISEGAANNATAKQLNIAASADALKGVLEGGLFQPYWEKVVSSSEIAPGEHPLIKDKSGLPNKIVLRAFFIDERDTENNTRVSYTVARDKFLEAANDPNPKLLQLPTYGAFPAVPATVSATYDNNKGGIEYVDIEFYRATTDIVIPSTNTKQSISLLSSDYLTANTREVVAAQGVALALNENNNHNIPWITSERYQGLNGVALSIASAKASITTTSFIDDLSASIAGVTGSIDKYIREVTAISNKISTLILTPSRLAEQILNSYSTLIDAITGPVDAYNYMKNRFTVLGNKYHNITDQALQTLGLQDDGYSLSVDQLHLNTQFNYMCTSAVDAQFFSSEEVLTVIDQLTTAFNLQVRINSSSPSYEDSFSLLQSMYGASLEYLLEQQALLPKVRTISTRENTPLLVTTYNLYGDIAVEELLALRNNTQSNLYPPTELEVLSA
jgi:prophage DNA circulation protein